MDLGTMRSMGLVWISGSRISWSELDVAERVNQREGSV
jgi:hypothetical protein